MLRNTIIASAIAALAATVAPASVATAQVVVCSNCANSATQLLQQADQARQLMTQAEQLATQIRSYEQMMVDATTLPDAVFADYARSVSALNDVMSAAQGIAYTAANLDEAFAQRYGSFESYRQSGVSDEDLQSKYRQWSEEANSTVLTTMRALGALSAEAGDEASRVNRLQARAAGARGHMEAMMVGNELSAETLASLARLRQLLMVQTQMQAQAMQLETDRDAVAAARARAFYRGDGPEYTGNTY